MTQSRANLFRYPPGSVGRRHIDPIQEEVFVVMEGTLTIHMGEDGATESSTSSRKGSVLVVQPGTALQLSNRHEDELRLFIVGAPPRARRDDLPRSGLTDGLLGAGLVAGIAVHDRRQHAIEGTTRVGRTGCS